MKQLSAWCRDGDPNNLFLVLICILILIRIYKTISDK